MSRIVHHTATHPSIVTTPHGDTVHICQCGLTQNADGTCSGAHKQTVGEEVGKTYRYDAKLTRSEVKNQGENSCCCDKCSK
jgi:CDGSH-type Zn-finger protein